MIQNHDSGGVTTCPPPRRDMRADLVDTLATMRFEAFRVRAKWFVLRAFDEEIARMGGDPWRYMGDNEPGRPPKDPFNRRPNPFEEYSLKLAENGFPTILHGQYFLGDLDDRAVADPPHSFPHIPGRPVYGALHYDFVVSNQPERAGWASGVETTRNTRRESSQREIDTWTAHRPATPEEVREFFTNRTETNEQ